MADKTRSDIELIPPEGSEGVGMAVVQMMLDILKYREDLKVSEQFSRFYKLRQNKHWKHNSKTKLVSANLLGSHHNRTVNMLTDNYPTFNAVPAGDLGDDGEAMLSLLVKTIDNWWRDTEQQHILENTVATGEMYGTVGEMVTYDPEIDWPSGDVRTETIDPLYVSYYPPDCKDRDRAEAAIRWHKMTVREARRRWPDFADVLRGDMSLMQEIGDERNDRANAGTSRKYTFLDNVIRWFSGQQESSAGADEDCDELMIVDCWVKDYRLTDDGMPLYPGNIRRVIVTNAGDVVLDDRWNPSINPNMPADIQLSNYLYNRFPINIAQSITDPHSPFGFSDFQQLETLNIEINKALAQFTLYKDRASRLKLINPRDSGVTNEELDNRPGIINPTNHLVAQSIRYMDTPPMPVDITAAMALYKDFFNEVSGTFSDVTQGQKQGSSVIAAKAIGMLLEEASRMARGKIRNYSKLIRERGRMYLALAQQWYDTERYITHQQDGQEITDIVTREKLQIAGKINVVSGSTMPVSHIQRREEAIELAKLGIIDQEEVLKRFDWDNYRDVVTRMQNGPLGEFLGRLQTMGVPEPVLQVFKQIAPMDPKEIQREVEAGRLPHFIQMMQQVMGQQQQQPPNPEAMKLQLEQQKMQMQMQAEGQKVQVEAQKAQIEAQKAQAEIQKTMAEIELMRQKIETEITERQIKMQGLTLDYENIKVRKAEAVARIQSQERADAVKLAQAQTQHMDKSNRHVEAAEKLRQTSQAATYNERGMMSNNKEL